MKKTILFLIFSIAISCNSSKNMTSKNIHKIWLLTEFSSFSKEYLAEKKGTLNLINSQHANAIMGCNNLSFPYKITENNSIVFSNGMATRMYCEDMKLENEFSKAIAGTHKFTLKGNQLILNNENGVKIIFTAKE